MTEPRSVRRWIPRLLVAALALVLVAAAGVVVWSQVGVYRAEPGPLSAVEGPDSGVTMAADSGAIVLSPRDAQDTTDAQDTADGQTPQVGLVFYPGAKVEAEAYVARLAPLVAEQGMTVVIVEPWLNLAMFDLRGLDAFTGMAPAVDTWIVGGHSLGGVRACQLAPEADALLLLASYCASDLSASDLPTLSIAGGEDGLSTPEKVAGARSKLPADAELVEIPGASHASFGDYGPQDGDGTASIDDEAMDQAVGEAVDGLRERLA